MPKTYEPIATQTLGSAAASVTFSSIPSTYTDLVLVTTAKSSTTGSVRLDLTFNSDTASNYSTTRLYGNGTTATSDRFANATAVDIGFLPGSNGTGFGFVLCNIQNYSNSTTNKTCLYRWNSQTATSGNQYTTAGVGLWRNTSAITTINLVFAGTNIGIGSTFTLYGIKAA
jgi:hypothetical protein